MNFIFPFSWECHHPHLTFIFFRGVGQPPTRYESSLTIINHHFPMVFLWFPYGFPMVFLWKIPYEWHMKRSSTAQGAALGDFQRNALELTATWTPERPVAIHGELLGLELMVERLVGESGIKEMGHLILIFLEFQTKYPI